MSNLTRDDVLKLARLARLKLSDDEVEQFGAEISAILDYVTQLKNVDTTGLLPTSQVTGLTNVTRKDAIKDYGTTQESLLANVPKTEAGQIKVKRMIG